MTRSKHTKSPLSWIAACCQDPSQEEVLRAAKAYVGSGLSLIPIRADGSKRPAFELLPRVWSETKQKYRPAWSIFRQRHPAPDELARWFTDPWWAYGMAILAGSISENLEIIDVDNFDVFEPWFRKVKKRAPGLLTRLVWVVTPRPGVHLYYRCSTIGGSEKLACVPEKDEETGKMKPKAIIETKGEGG